MKTSAASALFITKPRNFVRKPQSGAACGKKATINMCLEVAQHCSTSSTPIYVWDSFSAGFAALHQRLSIVKHLRRFHRNIYNHLIASDINRASG